MRKPLIRTLAVAIAGLLALAFAACGSSTSNSSNSNAGGGFNAATPVSGQKKGGTLTVPSVTSLQHLDPGQSYYQLDYIVDFAVNRGLYYYKPQDAKTEIPDIAEGMPEISSDQKTVTVKLKHGIKYGTNKKVPGVTGAEVSSADIKYAFERTKKPSVPNGYLGVYFPLAGGPSKGIATPDKYTVVFKLSKPFAATMAQALVMPITMPVPERYAAKFDAKTPDVYDTHPDQQAFTGPYMIKSYAADKSLTMVRNPQWDAKTDSRPAYVDKINLTMGAAPTVRDRQVLSGKNMVNADTLDGSTIKRAATKAPGQISFSPSGNRYVAPNTVKKPFDNVDVRKALGAVMDRRAMQLARGGSLVGDVANHFVPPGIPGFEQAGGQAGTGADWLKDPNGDLKLAQSYMKKAGFSSGKYTGPPIVMVGDNSSPAKDTTAVLQRGLEQLGFKVQLRSVDHSAFYDICQTVAKVKTKIDICANPGWIPDFHDPYAMVNATMNGEAIVPQTNPNEGLFDDKQINAAMDKGATLTGDARAKAWGDIDKQLVDKASAIPWFWDKLANLESKNVQGVIAQWNAAWDLAWTSIK